MAQAQGAPELVQESARLVHLGPDPGVGVPRAGGEHLKIRRVPAGRIAAAIVPDEDLVAVDDVVA
ncbi:hypothetical protein [Nonomuraea rosea]